MRKDHLKRHMTSHETGFTSSIYCIYDKRDRCVLYVGQTVCLKRRFENHCNANTLLGEYIRDAGRENVGIVAFAYYKVLAPIIDNKKKETVSELELAIIWDLEPPFNILGQRINHNPKSECAIDNSKSVCSLFRAYLRGEYTNPFLESLQSPIEPLSRFIGRSL
jgi:excinuclease UvrABC nuclease subunit